MNLQNNIIVKMTQGETAGNCRLNFFHREFTDDGPPYFVAECMEISGCVGQGTTKEEAERDLEAAITLCLHVMLEDCLQMATRMNRIPDLRGISSQREVSVSTPQLCYG